MSHSHWAGLDWRSIAFEINIESGERLEKKVKPTRAKFPQTLPTDLFCLFFSFSFFLPVSRFGQGPGRRRKEEFVRIKCWSFASFLYTSTWTRWRYNTLPHRSDLLLFLIPPSAVSSFMAGNSRWAIATSAADIIANSSPVSPVCLSFLRAHTHSGAEWIQKQMGKSVYNKGWGNRDQPSFMLGLTYVNIKREGPTDLFTIFRLVNSLSWCADYLPSWPAFSFYSVLLSHPQPDVY